MHKTYKIILLRNYSILLKYLEPGDGNIFNHLYKKSLVLCALFEVSYCIKKGGGALREKKGHGCLKKCLLSPLIQIITK